MWKDGLETRMYLHYSWYLIKVAYNVVDYNYTVYEQILPVLNTKLVSDGLIITGFSLNEKIPKYSALKLQ